MNLSERARLVSSHYCLCFDVEELPVTSYSSDDGSLSVDLIEATNVPGQGLTTVATLGLSDVVNASPSGDVRVEMLLAVPPEVTYAANALVTAAFDMIRGPYPGVWPGALKPRAIERNEPGAAMPDVLVVSPMCWEDLVPLPGVHFLQVIPVHASESVFASENGSDALEGLFVDRQIDVFDWQRAPVI